MPPEIILASSSPRRRALLAQAGYVFSVVHADIDESVLPGEAPEAHTERLAREKAAAVAARVRRGIVVAADTVVVVGDEILGKPADEKDALRMLSLLSGGQHRVVTGLAVLDAASGRSENATSVTKVWFRHLSSEEIAAYVATGEPLDKAGAYGIQERGALLAERIEGCFYNVVGLPLSLLCVMLESFGVAPWASVPGVIRI